MATRFYMRVASSPDAPTTGKKSTNWPTGGVTFTDASSGNESFSLSLTKGTAATSRGYTTQAQTAQQDTYIARFTSAQLAAQTIAANTWTLLLGRDESNAAANIFTGLSIYVWRPGSSSVVGYVYDTATQAFSEWPSPTGKQQGTVAASAVTSQDGDVLVFEWWSTAVQSMSTAYTANVWFDGTDDTAPTASTSDVASYLETPQTVTFFTPPAIFPPFPPPVRTLLVM